MGKFLTLMVGAVIFGASYLIFNGQRATFEAREQQSDYQYQAIASDIVKSGFYRGVSAIKRDLMDVTEAFERVSMEDGYYDLQITKNFYGDLEVSVDARSGGAAYDMTGRVIFTAPLPAVVALEDDQVAVNGSGNYQISGVDRRMPTQSSGGGFHDPVRGILTTYSNRAAFTNALQMNRVLGVGSSPEDPVNTSSVVGGFSEVDIEALYQEARQKASATVVAGVGERVPQGRVVSAAARSSPGDPAIIHAIGDLTITSNLQGYGLLIVEDGDLNVASNHFDWEGLILMRKQLKDTVAVNLRNTRLHGGLIAYDFDPGTVLPECMPGITIVDDEAVVADPFRVRFKVLGAAITAGGAYDLPVTVRIHMGDQVYEPWGDYDLPLDANINTGNSGVTYAWEPDVIFPAGTAIRVDSKSWLKNSGADGTQNSHWRVHLEMDSQASSSQLEVLKNGVAVPDVGGFEGQFSVEEFLGDYIEDRKMKLSTNQVVNLFELGVTDPGSSAFDMQDAVVLVTMVKDGDAACLPGGSPSRLEVDIQDDTQIHYSSEAIAKLGRYLDSIRSNTSVRVTESALRGRDKNETLTYEEALPGDDQEDEDENESGSDRVTVCHKPNKDGGSTKSIKNDKIAKHVAHGDYMGACSGWDAD